MNGLKQLFNKRALAATVSSALLLTSAVTAYAGYTYSVNAYDSPPLGGCSSGVACQLGPWYWCCNSSTDTCVNQVSTGCPFGRTVPGDECGYCQTNP
jgi:hypothetical protein